MTATQWLAIPAGLLGPHCHMASAASLLNVHMHNLLLVPANWHLNGSAEAAVQASPAHAACVVYHN
jgi:hypothetical protein